ncbi:hypothetical protein BGZ76_006247 [Entomortierella beljakovae]|nr:hypothetical protein BGZ76_006247 [Entomortierella beljakovae]
MLRLPKIHFFNATAEDTLAQSFLVPTNGFNISTPTKSGLDNYYGPGTVFQGQLNLQPAKPIIGPCSLRVIFTCSHSISSPELLSQNQTNEVRLSSDSQGHKTHLQPQHVIFETDHVFIDDELIQAKRHSFMFSIRFPRVNLPASMSDADRSVIYTLHGELSFQTTPHDASTHSTLVSPKVHVNYIPLVPTSIPHYPVIEMAQVMDPYTNKPLFKATAESPQRGVCPGESLPLSLTITNSSETDLHSIHMSLVRVMTYPTMCAHGGSTPLVTDPLTVHFSTIPISNTSNKNSTWQESIQFKVPSNLGLIPTTNKVITPLYKVDYYLAISLPVASRASGLASWFTPTIKNPPPIDISLVRTANGESGTGPDNENDSPISPRMGVRKNSVEKIMKVNLHMDRISTLNSTMKWPTLIQLPLIPVIIGTVSYSIPERYLRWPIPNYLDVEDRPRFIRDRFEEEMMQHLESLETLIDEEDDEQHIEDLVHAARRKSASSEESDEEEQRARSKIPERFRNGGGVQSRRKGSQSTSGLDTPPPSPPTSSHMSKAEGSTHSGGYSLPRGRRSMSPKAGSLGKEVLLEMHHSKIQQSIHAGLQDI